ncbi:putative lipoprotein [Bacillus cereus]|nr:putative lipoprotein [Bacillus cereus]
MDYSYGSKGILVSGKAKERQQYEIGYMDDNKLIGIDENIEDCIILDNKDEAGLIWKQIERGSIIEVQYGKDRNDIVGVQFVGDRESYEISDKFDRNTINEIVENVKGNL